MNLKKKLHSFSVSAAFSLTLFFLITLSGFPLLASAEPNQIAPVIQHTSPSQSIQTHLPLKLEAIVTDDGAVSEVMFFYRNNKKQQFYKIQMKSDGQSHYSAVVPQEEIKVPLLEYYIQATDATGNITLRGLPFFPLKILVSAQKQIEKRLPPSRSIFSAKTKPKTETKPKKSFLPPPSF